MMITMSWPKLMMTALHSNQFSTAMLISHATNTQIRPQINRLHTTVYKDLRQMTWLTRFLTSSNLLSPFIPLQYNLHSWFLLQFRLPKVSKKLISDFYIHFLLPFPCRPKCHLDLLLTTRIWTDENDTIHSPLPGPISPYNLQSCTEMTGICQKNWEWNIYISIYWTFPC